MRIHDYCLIILSQELSCSFHSSLYTRNRNLERLGRRLSIDKNQQQILLKRAKLVARLAADASSCPPNCQHAFTGFEPTPLLPVDN